MNLKNMQESDSVLKNISWPLTTREKSSNTFKMFSVHIVIVLVMYLLLFPAALLYRSQYENDVLLVSSLLEQVLPSPWGRLLRFVFWATLLFTTTCAVAFFIMIHTTILKMKIQFFILNQEFSTIAKSSANLKLYDCDDYQKNIGAKLNRFTKQHVCLSRFVNARY